uniref:Uncharacterized protein n=1 Tax=Cucumis melo TaxID=3656 RepID=A0A9I9DM79_CUCME
MHKGIGSCSSIPTLLVQVGIGDLPTQVNRCQDRDSLDAICSTSGVPYFQRASLLRRECLTPDVVSCSCQEKERELRGKNGEEFERCHGRSCVHVAIGQHLLDCEWETPRASTG